MVELTEQEMDCLRRVFVLQLAKNTKDREEILLLSTIYFKLTQRHLFTDFETGLNEIVKEYSR